MRAGKRLLSSAQREVLCISTPRRWLWIRPASRRALKWRERVDLGIFFRLTFKKLEQFWGQDEPKAETAVAEPVQEAPVARTNRFCAGA